jgi:hypothetical protein
VIGRVTALFLGVGCISGCASTNGDDNAGAPMLARVASIEGGVRQVYGIEWRPEIVEAFSSCVSGFGFSSTGRRTASLVRNWLAAAASVDECDERHMQFVSDIYPRIKFAVGRAYGGWGIGTCTKARDSLVIDLEHVANTIGARLTVRETECRDRELTKDIEAQRARVEQQFDQLSREAKEFLSQ